MTDLPPIPWETHAPKREARKPFDKKRAGLVVDLRRCVGCHACSVACKTEHDTPLGDFRARVRYLENPEKPQISFLPLLCMQCQDAPCLNACPSQALTQVSDGRIVVDAEACDATGACVSACPYDAIFINQQTGKADKCDLCAHRTSLDMDPACVTACPTDAIRFGDLADPQDPVAKLAARDDAKAFKEGEGAKPSVLYIQHEEWMETAAVGGVQLSSDEEEIVYEQAPKSARGRAQQDEGTEE